MRHSFLRFDDFVPGEMLGDDAQLLDEQLFSLWRQVFGDQTPEGADAGMAAGLALVAMMRSYMAVVSPRPPGNVHARQQFRLLALPRPGESIRTVFACAGKEVRRGRRCVELLAQGTGAASRSIYTGSMTMIWAA
jgi:hypothetical protein